MMQAMEITRRWPDDSPEGTLTRAFVAFAARDGQTLAALSSRASLDAYRAHVDQETNPQWHVWTAEALRQHQPEMPLEAAEWQVSQMAQHRDTHSAVLLRKFAGVRSVEELRKLDASELLTRALLAAPRGFAHIARLDVLGHVIEEAERAHVLYRLGWAGPDGDVPLDAGSPDLAMMTAEAGHWRLELDAYTHFGMPGFGNIAFIGEDAERLEDEGTRSGPDAPAS
jgi:hypothetical protein